MSGERIDIVCFDLGGVLVRICRSFEEACTRAGVPVRGDPATIAARTGDIDRLHTVGGLTERGWAAECARALGGLYAPDEFLAVYHAWLLGEYPGVERVVAAIHRAGVATACLSNTTEGHWERLLHKDAVRRGGNAPEFPTVFRLENHYASHVLGLRKPDEAIYRAFEKATSRRGRAILFFDDLPENVAAARRLGWRAELIDPLGETARELTDRLREHGVLGGPAASPLPV
jgi:glucose-1-phosphatase